MNNETKAETKARLARQRAEAWNQASTRSKVIALVVVVALAVGIGVIFAVYKPDTPISAQDCTELHATRDDLANRLDHQNDANPDYDAISQFHDVEDRYAELGCTFKLHEFGP